MYNNSVKVFFPRALISVIIGVGIFTGILAGIFGSTDRLWAGGQTQFIFVDKIYFEGDVAKSWYGDALRILFIEQAKVSQNLLTAANDEYLTINEWLRQKQKIEPGLDLQKWYAGFFQPDATLVGRLKLSDGQIRLNLALKFPQKNEQRFTLEAKAEDYLLLLQKASYEIFNRLQVKHSQAFEQAMTTSQEALRLYTVAKMQWRNDKQAACLSLQQALGLDQNFDYAFFDYLHCANLISDYEHEGVKQKIQKTLNTIEKYDKAYIMLFYAGVFDYYLNIKNFHQAEFFLVKYRSQAKEMLPVDTFATSLLDSLALKMHLVRGSCNEGFKWAQKQFQFLDNSRYRQYFYVKLYVIDSAKNLAQTCGNSRYLLHWSKLYDTALQSGDLLNTQVYAENAITIAHSYLLQKKPDLALPYFYSADSIVEKLQLPPKLSTAHLYYNIAVIEEGRHNAAKALVMYKKALSYYATLRYEGKFFQTAQQRVEQLSKR